MALPRPIRRLLLSFLWPRPTHTSPDEYASNYRAYYAPSKRRPRRPRKQQIAPSRCGRLSVLLFYLILAVCLAAKLAGRPLLAFPLNRASSIADSLTPATPNEARQSPKPAPEQKIEKAVAVRVDDVSEEMRPPQFGEAADDAASFLGDDPINRASDGGRNGANSSRVMEDALEGGEDELDVREEKNSSTDRAERDRSEDLSGDNEGSKQRRNDEGRSSVRNRERVQNMPTERRSVSVRDLGTRTCYHSSKTGDALCVHVPFCVRHNSLVYMTDTLRCAPYSNKQNKLGTLSMGRCVELERELEAEAQIDKVEHKPKSWLDTVDNEGNVLWFEGDSVFVRMGQKCKSVMHFVERIFMLHHVLQHPDRYGMGGVSNVVIAADETVATKIRYSKSWHHGLLRAIVYPNKLQYSYKTVRDLVSTVPATPSEMRVFVPSGLWDLAKSRLVPCFRRAALPGSVKSQFYLSEDVFPGVVSDDAETSVTKFHDADVFRTMLFQSLGNDGPPKLRKELLYLHRASTRTFSPSGLETFEAKLKDIGTETGFAYRFLDVAGMTFPEQVEAVAGAGVVVGIHGTQMLNTLFLPAAASVVEIFPFGYSNKMFQGGSGAGLHYTEYQLQHGEDFPQLSEFHGLENCIRISRECRSWYQSDHRKLTFGLLDAAALGKIVQQAIAHVENSLRVV